MELSEATPEISTSTGVMLLSLTEFESEVLERVLTNPEASPLELPEVKLMTVLCLDLELLVAIGLDLSLFPLDLTLEDLPRLPLLDPFTSVSIVSVAVAESEPLVAALLLDSLFSASFLVQNCSTSRCHLTGNPREKTSSNLPSTG